MTNHARDPFRPARRFAVGLIPFVIAAGGLSKPALTAPYDVKAHYVKSEHMVPMRDGVRLHTTVYAPRRSDAKLPFLLMRTPYGCAPYGPDASPV